MQIQEVINHIAAGDSISAKEGIENVLSAKAFNALQGRKQEMAATLFGGQEQEHEEIADDEESYAEDVEYDGEQLDEVSFKLANKAVRTRMARTSDDFHPAGSTHNPKNYTKSGESKSSLNQDRFTKKFGKRAVNRLDRVAKAYLEDVEHDGEQLDEVSFETAAKVYQQRAAGRTYGDTRNRYAETDVAQQERSKKIISSRFGKAGKKMTDRVDNTLHQGYPDTEHLSGSKRKENFAKKQ